MTLILSGRDFSKAYGSKPLFADFSLDLRAGEKIGLIGPNGAGKSTLLKILAGVEAPDGGSRSLRRSARLGYLSQDDTFPEGQTVREILVAAQADMPLEDHEREMMASKIITQFGFEDEDQPADKLSGGWKKRLSIGCQIIQKPDFLLLDEPTNHLDLPGVLWLERLLRNAPFGYLAATHDRAFLRAIADEILEINRVYPGGSFRVAAPWDEYADRRDAFLEAQARQQQSVANQVRKETEWLGRKAAARTRKASSRIEAAADRREELADLKSRNASAGAAGIDFAGTGRQTRKLLSIAGLGKSLGNKPLFSGLEMILSPGTKLGLLGPNGSGKSTLLKLIAGILPPDEGTVTRAEGLRSVMFEQGRANLDLTQSLKKALCPNGETIVVGGREWHVAAWAKRFLFDVDQLPIELSALSGGEQARVRIAQLMVQPADLLLLDEPTNDLDIPALEVLEESLTDFPGAVVIVSHDRELLDRLCTEVIGLDGKGNSALYGSVSQWLTAYEKGLTPKETPKAAAATATAKPKTVKLSYKEQQEWDGMEAKVLKAEELLAEKSKIVEASATAKPSVLQAACKEMEDARRAVEKLYARWQELEAKRGGG